MSDHHEHAVFGFPAAVRATPSGDREQLLALARARASDATVFDRREPFFWAAIISNTRVDYYWTHMARSSLENYARGAQAGVSFQNSHRWNELPLGASLTGNVETLDSGLVQVVSDFYTLLGMQLNGVSTEQFADGVRSGVIKDVSIGWSGGRMICDICHGDYTRYDTCQHWAGREYEIEIDGVTRKVRATVTIEDANLHEVSAVYDGATPGAVILKARAAAADGFLRGKEVEVLEQMYRVALPAARRFGGADTEQSGQTPKFVAASEAEARGSREDERMNEQQFAQLVDTLIRAGALTEEQRATVSEGEALTAADKLAARVAELEPRAADGDTYRNDLVSEALAEGVRAYGQTFDQETYEATLRTSPLAVVKRMRDDWKRVGDTRFAGGRQTTDGEGERERAADRYVPDASYSA